MDSNLNDSLTQRLPSKFEDISYDTNKLLKKIIEQSIITISPKNKQSISICDEKKYQCEFSILETIIDNEDNHISKLSKGNSKNRYSDIRVYEYNKVSLKTNEYINASFIHIPNENSFISTQGPIESSINDFWEMILEYNTKIIIMLCNQIEGGREKCTEYWKGNKLCNIKYTEEKKENLIKRNITISNNKLKKEIKKFKLILLKKYNLYEKYNVNVEISKQNKEKVIIKLKTNYKLREKFIEQLLNSNLIYLEKKKLVFYF